MRKTAPISCSALAATLLLAGCGAPDIEVQVKVKQTLQESISRWNCAVGVDITNHGSQPIKAIDFRLEFDGTTSLPLYLGAAKNIKSGATTRKVATFAGLRCDRVPGKLKIVVEECVMGDKDCKQSVALKSE